MHPSIFKAYDVRGRYPEELDAASAFMISRVAAGMLGRGPVVVAHDARVSSPALYRAVRRGLKRAGRAVVAMGFATTPMFYFLVNDTKAAGGIMVTGSHTPWRMNGLKIVKKGAEPISGTEILASMQKLKVKM